MPDCIYGTNPLGTCECDGQFFISDDCLQGFLCTTNIPDPYINDGCLQTCLDGQILSPDFSNQQWECLDNSQDEYTCPGCLEVVCPANEIVPDASLCECSGQLLVDKDCNSAFFCLEDGGRPLICPAGQMISFSLPEWEWECVAAHDNCPHRGGFKLGCFDDYNATISPDYGCDYAENPLGDCECDGQFFINGNCTQGFLCHDSADYPDFDGCIRTCDSDQILIPDFATKSWACVGNWNNERVCPGAFKLECSDYGGSYTADNCTCDRELIISADCSEGFFCFDLLPAEGAHIKCPEGMIVDINLHTWTWRCQEDNGNCPGLGGFRFGCPEEGSPVVPEPVCTYEMHPFDECDGCDGQVFVNSDCTEGFVCLDEVPDPESQEGCRTTCQENEIVVPNFASGYLECHDNSDGSRVCPGQFHIRCEDDALLPPFNNSVCDCEGQLHISPDCRHGFICRSILPNGGANIDCGPGEIVDVDVRTWVWQCVEDNGRCPGLGGFSVGCQGDGPEVPAACQEGVNPIGVCDGCDGQVFINRDCSQAFECLAQVSGDQGGCLYECGENEIVTPDYSSGLFYCRSDTLQDQVCPGEFKINCASDPVTPPFSADMCDCNGQIFISQNCNEGFLCNRTGGEALVCEDGEVIDFNFLEWSYDCSPAPGNCPNAGGYTVGCAPGSVPVPTECVLQENSLGTCQGCPGQLFLSDDCREAFVCPGEGELEGCLYSCGENELIIPDFIRGSFSCAANSFNEYSCPGKLKQECEDTAVEFPFDSQECDCDGQLFVSPDCREAFVCLENFPGGGIPYSCNESEIINVNFLSYAWECIPDEGNCPGLGGFAVGCEDSSLAIPQGCSPGINPIGNCSCDGQVFINPNCTQAFECLDELTQPDVQDGCLYECGEDQIMVPDFISGRFFCRNISDSSNSFCPGEFKIECEENALEPPLTSDLCECNGQLHVTPDCESAFFCLEAAANGGIALDCPPGFYVEFDLEYGTWQCVQGNGNCPGAGGFSIGCAEGSITLPPTLPTRPTTSETTAASPTTSETSSQGSSQSTASASTTASETTSQESSPTTTTEPVSTTTGAATTTEDANTPNTSDSATMASTTAVSASTASGGSTTATGSPTTTTTNVTALTPPGGGGSNKQHQPLAVMLCLSIFLLLR